MINKNSSKLMHMNLDLRPCEGPDDMRRLEAVLKANGGKVEEQPKSVGASVTRS